MEAEVAGKPRRREGGDRRKEMEREDGCDGVRKTEADVWRRVVMSSKCPLDPQAMNDLVLIFFLRFSSSGLFSFFLAPSIPLYLCPFVFYISLFTVSSFFFYLFPYCISLCFKFRILPLLYLFSCFWDHMNIVLL